MTQQQFKRQLMQAQQASQKLAALTTAQKNKILADFSVALTKNATMILAANKRDFAKLSKDYPHGDRLLLTKDRLKNMAESVRAVTKLPDPVGKIIQKRTLKNGLRLSKISVPFGVVGIIYESRPNVTAEIFSLTLKTGNVVILKGGPDAEHSNRAIIKIIHAILKRHSLPTEAVVNIDPINRALVRQMMRAQGLIDVLIPRGSNRLIEAVRKTALIPVIETGAGVCHVYVEKSANLTWAKNIIGNAKTRRVSVCNALDTLVIDHSIARVLFETLTPELAKKEVILYSDPPSYKILASLYPAKLLKKARPSDFGREFLSMAMAIKTVAGAGEGLAHIKKYTSGHSEAIVTSDKKTADRFTHEVDAAAVYVNAPTSFTDGFEFGLGAEIGISTQKLHARGPMGLAELTTYKWVIMGQGQVRP